LKDEQRLSEQTKKNRDIKKKTQRKLIEKENEKRKLKLKMRKLNFLKKMERKILQGGYQISSDTMLGNMASMDEGEKS